MHLLRVPGRQGSLRALKPMAEVEGGKESLLEAPADVSRSAKSPPRLQIPAQTQPVVDDNYLFSPGVDTPGHKLPKSQPDMALDSPMQRPGCLGLACLGGGGKKAL